MAQRDAKGVEGLRVQAQIRANAEEMQDYLRDLGRWEKDMTKRDGEVKRRAEERRPARQASTSVRASCGTVKVEQSAVERSDKECEELRPSSSTRSAADHTYDKGYARWERFNVQEALAEAADDNVHNHTASSTASIMEPQGAGKPGTVTPASITSVTSSVKVDKATVARPPPRLQPQQPPEEREREAGNAHFRKGEFALAVRCYTRCIGHNSKSAVAFSNRAMAYLKLKEFVRAEEDASTALKFDPSHIKSLQRRACARSSRGMHRAALLDLRRAIELDPSSKELQVEARRVREMIRAAIRRVHKVHVPVQVVTSSTESLGGTGGATDLSVPTDLE